MVTWKLNKFRKIFSTFVFFLFLQQQEMTTPDNNPTSDTNNGGNADSGTHGLTSLKIPPYWPSDPHLWFAQVEAQFFTKRITSQKVKFSHVVASLAPEFASVVRDIYSTYLLTHHTMC